MFNMWINPINNTVKVYRAGQAQAVLTALSPVVAVNAIRVVYGKGNYVRVKTKSYAHKLAFDLLPNRYGNTFVVV